MRRRIFILTALAITGVGLGLFITRPDTVNTAEYENLIGDPTTGALVFAATGCASCHANPETKEGLGGGHAFATDFGTFYAPNISQHPIEGIGEWSLTEFASAVVKGTSPEGAHYYPAFPYTSYSKMTAQDITDLFAYLKTTQAEAIPSRLHSVGFPFNIRASLGGWKLLFFGHDYVLDAGADPVLNRGRYLVEVMGHCAECHTPRNALGGVQRTAWLAGGPNPDGPGRIPNITPSEAGIGSWGDDALIEYFKTGFTPDFDVVGGSMASVQANLSKLPDEDLAAIVAYLNSVQPLD
ncbi:MAG: cytochrome c [Pseudomonadota bacterium]